MRGGSVGVVVGVGVVGQRDYSLIGKNLGAMSPGNETPSDSGTKS